MANNIPESQCFLFCLHQFRLEHKFRRIYCQSSATHESWIRSLRIRNSSRRRIKINSLEFRSASALSRPRAIWNRANTKRWTTVLPEALLLASLIRQGFRRSSSARWTHTIKRCYRSVPQASLTSICRWSDLHSRSTKHMSIAFSIWTHSPRLTPSTRTFQSFTLKSRFPGSNQQNSIWVSPASRTSN